MLIHYGTSERTQKSTFLFFKFTSKCFVSFCWDEHFWHETKQISSTINHDDSVNMVEYDINFCQNELLLYCKDTMSVGFQLITWDKVRKDSTSFESGLP